MSSAELRQKIEHKNTSLRWSDQSLSWASAQHQSRKKHCQLRKVRQTVQQTLQNDFAAVQKVAMLNNGHKAHVPWIYYGCHSSRTKSGARFNVLPKQQGFCVVWATWCQCIQFKLQDPRFLQSARLESRYFFRIAGVEVFPPKWYKRCKYLRIFDYHSLLLGYKTRPVLMNLAQHLHWMDKLVAHNHMTFPILAGEQLSGSRQIQSCDLLDHKSRLAQMRKNERTKIWY